mmetsp:Transcript_26109/g.72847  ORF Transcript_26109/g.72847 Transcript_26109/m.72847 type:complete len:299 (-) Transcript_26109:136-1032(-)
MMIARVNAQVVFPAQPPSRLVVKAVPRPVAPPATPKRSNNLLSWRFLFLLMMMTVLCIAIITCACTTFMESSTSSNNKNHHPTNHNDTTTTTKTQQQKIVLNDLSSLVVKIHRVSEEEWNRRRLDQEEHTMISLNHDNDEKRNDVIVRVQAPVSVHNDDYHRHRHQHHTNIMPSHAPSLSASRGSGSSSMATTATTNKSQNHGPSMQYHGPHRNNGDYQYVPYGGIQPSILNEGGDDDGVASHSSQDGSSSMFEWKPSTTANRRGETTSSSTSQWMTTTLGAPHQRRDYESCAPMIEA